MKTIIYYDNELKKDVSFTLNEKDTKKFGYLNAMKGSHVEEYLAKYIQYLARYPTKFFKLDYKEQKHIINNLGYKPDLNDFYPKEYLDIYEREKELRNISGYQNLIKLDNELETKKFKFKVLKRAKDLEYKGKIKGYKKTMNYFFDTIYSCLGEDRKYITIAGGSALYSYKLFKQGKITKFDDVDLFFHSCTVEKAIDIIRKFNMNINGKLGFTMNSVSINNSTIPCKIQFILRIYSSPSQIIHGFDIDSSCILRTEEGEFYTTERGYYALTNNVNIFNFDRMSPSYEYRLLKYVIKGFDVFIPAKDLFLNNLTFDLSTIRKPIRHSDIFNIDYIKTLFGFESGIYGKGLNYDTKFNFKLHLDFDDVEFIVNDPNKQTNSSFRQIVMKNNLNWFMRREKLKRFIVPTDEEIMNDNPISIDNLIVGQEDISDLEKLYSITLQLDIDILNNTHREEFFTDNTTIYPKSYSNLLCPFVPYLNHKDYFMSTKLNDFLGEFKGEVVVCGNYPLSNYLQRKFIGTVDFYFYNTSDTKKLTKKIIKTFCTYFLDEGSLNLEITKTEIDKYTEVKYDVEDNTIEQIYVPVIRIYKGNNKTYREIMDKQELDFNKIIMRPKNHYGEYLLDNKTNYCINNKIHFSSFVTPTLSHKTFFNFGFRFIFDDENTLLTNTYENINVDE